MSATPIKLERAGESDLLITWSDGEQRRYTALQLRDACPCASCREKAEHPPASPMELPVITPAEARPLRVEAMQPVGSYAYAISFSDGHDTGIYAFDLLKALGSRVGEPS